MFASIVINVSSSNVDQMYEYAVLDNIAPFIKVGARVNVEFGQGNRLVMGYVLDLYEEKRFEGPTKYIIELLDIEPVITPLQLELAKYLKDDTICPLIRILNLMLPEALQLKTFKYLVVKDSSKLDATLIDVFNGNTYIEVNSKLDKYAYKIQKEITNGNIEIAYESKQVTNYKYVNKYAVNLDNFYKFSSEIKNPLKLEFLNRYKDSEYLTIYEILANYDISYYMVKDLYKKGFLEIKKERTLRIKNRNISYINELEEISSETVSKTIEKLTTINSIPYLYMPSSINELNEVLVNVCKNVIENNKNVVIVCADILSSVKYASIIRKLLNVNVACINSNLSRGELLDLYTEIKNDIYEVIVTTPKGVFYPFQNVGMYFMLDEESDNYYNDQSPRYDLHKALYFLSYNTKANFIMSSMSPSVSNYCYGLKGLYKIVDNTNLFVNSNVEVVNMMDELKKGNNTYLSNRLKNALIKTNNNKQQSLLIINNKSYSNYCLCPQCGNVPKCPYCEISLNYNEKNNILICPACSYRMPFTNSCTSCGNTKLRFGGIGIESMTELINKELPHLNVLAIDTNNNFELFSEQMAKVEDKVVDVIITTETYSKSIVDKYVGLVGIVNFDSTLKTPSYDAESRAFNLLVYASEKISANNGLLLVQTTNTKAPSLTNFITGDYKAFLRTEIENRKLMHNEPFYHINRIIIKAEYSEMFKVATNIKNVLKELAGSKVFVIGPTYSKQYSGTVLIVKHNYSGINDLYKKIYELYQNTQTVIIFDKYPRKL